MPCHNETSCSVRNSPWLCYQSALYKNIEYIWKFTFENYFVELDRLEEFLVCRLVDVCYEERDAWIIYVINDLSLTNVVYILKTFYFNVTVMSVISYRSKKTTPGILATIFLGFLAWVTACVYFVNHPVHVVSIFKFISSLYNRTNLNRLS